MPLACSIAVVAARPDWRGLDGVVLVVGLLVGLPHGAVDHQLPRYRQRPGRTVMALVALAYAATAVLAWFLLHRWPAAGLVVFLALSLAHFATSEATFARLRRGGRGAPVLGATLGAATAVTVLLLPIALRPQQVAPYLSALVPGFDGVLPVWTLGTTLAVAATLLVAAVASGVRRRWWSEVGELVLLATLALLAPPTVVLAVYFGAWHSLRHLAVLLGEDPDNASDLAGGRLVRPVTRLARTAAWPTAVAAGAIVLLGVSVGGDRTHLVAVVLGVLAALTVPHALVVWWLDHTRSTGHDCSLPRASEVANRSGTRFQPHKPPSGSRF